MYGWISGQRPAVGAIHDFQAALDKINLDPVLFYRDGGSRGPLAASAFTTGATASDASDRIIYDKATGSLYFDADGTGSIAQVKFAILSANLSLTAANFELG